MAKATRLFWVSGAINPQVPDKSENQEGFRLVGGAQGLCQVPQCSLSAVRPEAAQGCRPIHLRLLPSSLFLSRQSPSVLTCVILDPPGALTTLREQWGGSVREPRPAAILTLHFVAPALHFTVYKRILNNNNSC